MAFATEAFTLLGIGLFVISLRLYVRISTAGIKHLYVDDYLMVLAAASGLIGHAARAPTDCWFRWSTQWRHISRSLSEPVGRALPTMR